MAVTVGNILAILDEIAPPDGKEDYDNVGLLAGHISRPVDKVLVALDLTLGAVEEAVQIGAQLIVTHHPIFFRGRKNIREDDAEGAAVCALIREGLSLIAVHTNFDNAPLGVNDALAQALQLNEIRPLEHGIRTGRTQEPTNPECLRAFVQNRLGGCVRLYAPRPDMRVVKVAVCGGAGGEFYELAASAGAQAFITGEVKYHEALAAMAYGLCVIEAGHYETEHIAIKLLTDCLQKRADELQYNVTVAESGYVPFWCVGT